MAVDIGQAFKLGSKGIAEPGSGYGTIGEAIGNILPNVYLIAGLILFVLFLGAGFAIMTAGDNPEQQGKGMEALSTSLIGFLVIFLSYWIIQIIEYVFGIKIFQTGL